MKSNLSTNPLFIIGSPRSGTSMLRLVLTSHPQVLIPPECGFIIWLHREYADWQQSYNTDPGRMEVFLDNLFACKKFDTWLMDRAIVQERIMLRRPSTYAGLCREIYSCFGARIDKNANLWGDKNNFYLHHLDELLDLYEGARFLHIVRDGRDVACSYREVMVTESSSPYAPKLETEIGGIAREWSQNVAKIDLFMTALPPRQAMTIRYEDLTQEPVMVVSSVCEWLNIPFDADMLNFYKLNKSERLEPALTMDWKKRTLQPINPGTIGRYRRLLNDGEQQMFLDVAASSLQRFSYR